MHGLGMGDGLLEIKKKITDQYAEEKRWVFSFDLRECRQMPDRDRKRVPDHRSNVLRGSKVVFLRVHVGFLFTIEEQKRDGLWRIQYFWPTCWPSDMGCWVTVLTLKVVFLQLSAITDMDCWATILTLCFHNFQSSQTWTAGQQF